jgi:uncharacterized glyoxalase superfamily protein PhnB
MRVLVGGSPTAATSSMPLDDYGFSKTIRVVADRFGVSWQ